jgi:hypothetical protein
MRPRRIFKARRNAFPPERIDGARKIQGVHWGGLMAMRDLRGSRSTAPAI